MYTKLEQTILEMYTTSLENGEYFTLFGKVKESLKEVTLKLKVEA